MMMDATNNHASFNTTHGLLTTPSIVKKPVTDASLPATPRATTPEADTFASSKPKIPAPTVTPDKTPLILSGLSFLTSLAGVGLITWATFFKEPAKATDSVETAVTAAVKPLKEEITKLVQKPASGGASVDHGVALADLKALVEGLPKATDIATEVLSKIQGQLDALQTSMNDLPSETLNAFKAELKQLHDAIANIKTGDNTALTQQLDQLQQNIRELVAKNRVEQVGKGFAEGTADFIKQSMLNHKRTAGYATGKVKLDVLRQNIYPDPLTLEDFHGFLAALTPEEKKNPALLLEVVEVANLRHDTITQLADSLDLVSPAAHNQTSVSQALLDQNNVIQDQLKITQHILKEYSNGVDFKIATFIPTRIQNNPNLSFLEPVLEKMKNFESIDDGTPTVFKYLTDQVKALKEAEDNALKLIAERKQAIIDSPYPFDLKGKAKPTTPQALFDGMPNVNPIVPNPLLTEVDPPDPRGFLGGLLKNLVAIATDETGLKYDITNPKLLSNALNKIGFKIPDYYEASAERDVFQASAKLLEACLPLEFDLRKDSPKFASLDTKDAEAALQAFQKAYDKAEVLDIAQAFIEANINVNKLPQGSADQIEAYSKAMKEATQNAFKYLHKEYENLPDAVRATPASS
ncbi:MAG: hypothetical protein H2174_02080 [Vampirovibrio sp.]|nr:hypothetical protein [Vampirovibrio sp.]